MVVEILGTGFRGSGGKVGDSGGGDGDGGVVSMDQSGLGLVCIARQRGCVGGI